jgi:hypothetical protein
MTGPNSIERRVEVLADDIRRLLEQVVEQARERRWDAASRHGAALVDATRRLQNEVDFCSMNEWLERAKTA